MSIADSLLTELRSTHDLTREFLFAKIASDYGDGFARVLREELEKMERKQTQ
jgi:hypothetical protein